MLADEHKFCYLLSLRQLPTENTLICIARSVAADGLATFVASTSGDTVMT